MNTNTKSEKASAGQKSRNGKIDTSISGWFRALVPVDSMFQSWECIGWFRNRTDAEDALSK